MFKKSFVYMFGQAASSLLALLLLPIYTRYLTPEEFGIATLILISTSFGVIIFTFGLNSGYLIKYYKVDLEWKRRFFSLIMIAFVSIAPLMTILTVAFVPWFRTKLGFQFNTTHWLLFGGAVTCGLYYQFFLTILRVQLRAKLFVAYNVSYAIFMGALNLIFLIIFKLSYFSFLYSSAITNFCFMLIGAFLYGTLFVKVNFKKNIKEYLQLIKIGLVIMPSQITTTILTNGDRYVINAIAGANAVGIYSIAYRIGSFFESFINVPFFNVYNPIAYKQFSDDKQKFKELQKKYLIIYSLFLGVCFVGFSIVFEHLFRMLIDHRYWSVYPLIWFVALSYIFQGISYIFEVVQAMYEKMQYLMYITLFCTFLNLTLNFILVPHLGIKGAAIANLICYILMAVGTFIFNNKILRIEYDIKKALLILVICSLIVIAQHVFNVSGIWLNIFIKGIWAMLCFLILYFINSDLVNDFFKKDIPC